MSPFLGDLFGALDGLEIGTNEGAELGFCDDKLFGRTLGALYGFTLVT